VPPSAAEEAHDALLRADLSRADSVERLGYASGMATLLSGDVLYLRGGLPILRGRLAAIAVASTESIDGASTVRWQPVRAEASDDGTSGFSYGYAIRASAHTAVPGAAPNLRVDRYIAYWEREPAGWRIRAYAEMYGTPPQAIQLPDAAHGAALSDVPMPPSRGALDAVRRADVAFAASAAAHGTASAFGRYAAHDAQVFSGPGDVISGPEAITLSFSLEGSGSALSWHPVAAGVSNAGDLGFTVGYARVDGRPDDGRPRISYSKYLTIWKRQPDGQWHYVVDGGSARPAEP
jgi:ketosteroid isomerase-like protein